MAPTASSYDLFLSYNSADHTLVEEIARKIRDQHLEPFLDRWYLAPGARWRSKLEDTFQQHGVSLLEKLEGYIGSCDRIISLIGDAYGFDPEETVRPEARSMA